MNTAMPVAQPGRWKRIGFVVAAVLFTLFGFVVLEGAIEAMAPWIPVSNMPDSHSWLAASHGTLLAFLFGGSLIAMLRRPFEKPMLLHFYAVGHLIFLATFAITAPKLALEKAFVFVMFFLVLSVLYSFYHNRALAVRLESSAGYSRPLVWLTVVAAVILLPVAIHACIQQFSETGEYFRWGEHGAMLLALIYAGFLTASQRPGSLALGVIVSMTYAYLGAAALAVPEHPGSWGIAGGLASLVYSLVYAVVLLYSKRAR
ncbi:hypothetical protein ACFPPD_19945 [Cohnella suwonensis]|uniref:Uncharacterized protein n=1 Tax=Cohnella suwonensis TaxID=696072 RepID=A0ABW0LYS2_9BACL